MPMPDETETLEAPRERRNWLRIGGALLVTFLLISNIALYSLHKALTSRVEGQDHRIERLQQMVTDMLKANQNAEKIEKIETQVDSIGVQVTDLTTTIQAQDAKADEKAASQKKKRR
jgi:hypothetical protein